jgi:hypothetical protein
MCELGYWLQTGLQLEQKYLNREEGKLQAKGRALAEGQRHPS